jgi:hypothetical protein
MKHRLPLMLSAIALVVALLSNGPLVSAASGVVRHALFADKARIAAQANFAKTAGSINGIKASRTPRAGRLIPLNVSSLLPASVVPRVDATSVDGFSASQSPVAGMLLPLNANGALDPLAMPRIAARASSGSEQAIPRSAPGPTTPETLVKFDSVTFDTNHLFDAASPTRLTISIPGIYLVTGTVYWASTAFPDEGRVVRLIADNQQGGATIASDQAGFTGDAAQTISSVYAFAAGDHVLLEVGASTDTKLLAGSSLTSVWLAPAP